MDSLFTTNIFLDTSTFIKMNFDFENFLLTRLVQLSEDEHITIFTTEVTKQEIISNIQDMVDEARAPINSIRKEGRILRNIADYNAIFDRKRLDNVAGEIIGNYEDFNKSTETTIVSVEGISVRSLMSLYFNKQAPFSNKKKSEFPDAISLLALDKWCGDNNQNMYIISTDNDLSEYCADNSRLSYLSSIDEFIDLLVSDSEHQHSFIVSAFLVHGELLEESIKEEIEDFIFDIWDDDGDVDSIKVTGVEIINEPNIVAINNSRATLTFDAQVDIEADVSVLDYNDSYYDKEEGKYIIRNYNNFSVEDDITVSFSMEIEFNINDKTEFDIISNKITNQYLSINVNKDEY
ncbi:PIN domain-containing protein [Paenibacillus sp. P46E]|uniref:PIN domain-containing protein n=1 Tax=Paenibacillus sp. P46E TaxID=1349436 RepID=UPI000968DE96|nr:PIN domain-containing protein [Paenibacillus sp. P46E]OKP99245.1 hypothetical protein A3849_06130 [Paenibacillus sp. P46E]